jgi:class III poly(R)-hydroxyalkanoic acid synthase PhaE subunit
MDWTQQTKDLLDGWTEVQKQFWAGPLGWAGQAESTSPTVDPTRWLKTFVDSWSAARGNTADQVAGNVLGTPDLMIRSMSLLMKAWEVVAPQIGAGKPWRHDLKKLMDQWRQEIATFPQRQVATASEFVDLTRTLFECWSPTTGPWLQIVTQALVAGHPGAAFLGGTAGLNRAMGFDEGVAPILMGLGELPRATVMREKMGKMLKAADALTDLRAAQSEYHLAMMDALARAVERTMEHLATSAREGETISSARDLMRTWFTNADRTLNETFTSPQFVGIRDQLTNAMMAYKIRQRDALEVVYFAMEIPLRSEVDEAHRDIHDLKRQIRVLSRQVKELADRIPEKPRKGTGSPRRRATKSS